MHPTVLGRRPFVSIEGDATTLLVSPIRSIPQRRVWTHLPQVDWQTVPIMTGILDELHWRGLVSQTTDEASLRAALDAGPITLYCGFDPTAPSLHLGNLMQILTVRRFQDLGHKPLLLVGGATGLIGDPRMSGERTLNPVDVVEGWVGRIRAQIEPHLKFDGSNAARMVNNYEWTSTLDAITFLRDVGKHFRMGTMLAKETVAQEACLGRGDLVHRVLLPGASRDGFPRALPTVWLHAADGGF